MRLIIGNLGIFVMIVVVALNSLFANTNKLSVYYTLILLLLIVAVYSNIAYKLIKSYLEKILSQDVEDTYQRSTTLLKIGTSLVICFSIVSIVAIWQAENSVNRQIFRSEQSNSGTENFRNIVRKVNDYYVVLEEEKFLMQSNGGESIELGNSVTEVVRPLFRSIFATKLGSNNGPEETTTVP